MNSPQEEEFVEALLNQMPQLNSEQYTRYRRELDDKLVRARQEEKAMRRIVAGAWAAAFAVCASAVLCARSNPTSQGQIPDSLLFGAASITLLTPVAALMLLALYLFKYRRKVTVAEGEKQEAALGELQRQLNELRAQLLNARENQ